MIRFQKMSRALQETLGLLSIKGLRPHKSKRIDPRDGKAVRCKKIKEILKDKIQEGKISEGWIEECLPREYKRKYTRTESQQNHLSELVVSAKGNQISQSDIDSKAPHLERPMFSILHQANRSQ